jgi:valyl-tRNA synthetase
MNLLETYGSDALRYWASSARPGVDTAYDEGQMKIGRKLAIKILNVAKFVLGFPETPGARLTDPVDLAMAGGLGDLVRRCTEAFEQYDYARSLELTEAFFWWFCDDFVELVKARAYGSRGDEASASAVAALRLALSALLRLFAPMLPFVTEEVWSWWHDGSIHRAAWPRIDEVSDALAGPAGSLDDLRLAGDVLGDVRRAKTEAKRSMRWEVTRLSVTGGDALLQALAMANADLREAGNVTELVMAGGPRAVEVELAAGEVGT